MNRFSASSLLVLCVCVMCLYNRKGNLFFFLMPPHSSPFASSSFGARHRQRETERTYTSPPLSTPSDQHLFLSLSLSLVLCMAYYKHFEDALVEEIVFFVSFFFFRFHVPRPPPSLLCCHRVCVYRSLYLSVLFELKEAEIFIFIFFLSFLSFFLPFFSFHRHHLLIHLLLIFLRLLIRCWLYFCCAAVERRHQQLRMETVE